MTTKDLESSKDFRYLKEQVAVDFSCRLSAEDTENTSQNWWIAHIEKKPLHQVKLINVHPARTLLLSIVFSILITTIVFILGYYTIHHGLQFKKIEFNTSVGTERNNKQTQNDQKLLFKMKSKRITRSTECQKMYIAILEQVEKSDRDFVQKLISDFQSSCANTSQQINIEGKFGGDKISATLDQIYEASSTLNTKEPVEEIIATEDKVITAEDNDDIEKSKLESGTRVASGNFPATGPSAPLTGTGGDMSSGLSGPDDVKTNQLLTVSLPSMVQQICFLGPKVASTSVGGQFSAPDQQQPQQPLPNYICTPIQQQQPPNIQTLQRIDTRRSISIPTAVSSANPYFFQGLSGSPVLTQPTTIYQPSLQQGTQQPMNTFYQKPQSQSYSSPGAVTFSPQQQPIFQQPTVNLQSQQGVIQHQQYQVGQQQPAVPYSQNYYQPPPVVSSQVTGFLPQQTVQQPPFYQQQQQPAAQAVFSPQGNTNYQPLRPLQYGQTLPMLYNQQQPQPQPQPGQQQPQVIYQNPVIVPSFPTGSDLATHQVYCTYVPQPNAPMQTYTFPSVQGGSEYKATSSDGPKSKNTDKVEIEGKANEVPKMLTGEPCSIETVPCADGLCIPKNNWCDGKVDCVDLSDEANCSCAQLIPKHKQCDGFHDCPNGEDELACSVCGLNAYCCDDWSRTNNGPTCIPLSQRCNNEINCPNGNDEKDCILITEIINQHNPFVMSYGKGFLQRNWEGRWYPVCPGYYPLAWASNACAAEYGQLHRRPKLGTSKPNGYFDDGIQLDALGRMIILPKCGRGLVTTVDCGVMLCGTRMFNERSFNVEMYERIKRHIFRPPACDLLKIMGDQRDNNRGSILCSPFGYIYNKKETNSLSRDRRYSTLAGEESSLLKNLARTKQEGRVVGGMKSKPGFWPWLIALYRDGLFHCGGVIINHSWILTAAHCVVNFEKHFFEVQAGILRRLSYSPQEQSRKVVNVIVHEEYNSEDMRNDIALIHLGEELKFNRWVRPICLPDPGSKKLPLINSMCVAVGWGSTFEHGPDPDNMHEVQVPILESCKHRSDILGDEICAGTIEGGKDTCQGDSGGPLLCRIPDYVDRWYVAGLVSHGEGCGRPGEPGVYTRVYNFIMWIVKNMNKGKSSGPKPVLDCPGLRCKGGRCLPKMEVCDGVVHCLGLDDEQRCTARSAEGKPANNVTSHSSSFEKSVFDNLVDDDGNAYTSTEGTTPSTVDYGDSTGHSEPGLTTTEIAHIEDSTTQPVISIPMAANFKDEKVKGFFTCRLLMQQIHVKRRCDGIIDCEDGTDELECTCKDKLSIVRPHYICDKITHCKDGCDEKECSDSCYGDFHCSKTGKCVSHSQLCDDYNDCGGNEDEINCFTLVKDLDTGVQLDVTGRPKFLDRGIAMKYNSEKDKWLPVQFLAANPIPKALQVCFALGYMGYEKLELVTMTKNETDSECDTVDKDVVLHLECSVLKPKMFGSHMYSTPWHAFIYANGQLKATAVLITTNLLMASRSILTYVDFQKDYVVAVLGVNDVGTGVVGAYDQYIRVDGMRNLEKLDAILLHLSKPAQRSYQVRPIGYPKRDLDLKPTDTCQAQILGRNNSLITIDLQVEKKCDTGKWCFRINYLPMCNLTEMMDLSGGIICPSDYGLYLADIYPNLTALCEGLSKSYVGISDHLATIKLEIEKEWTVQEKDIGCDTVRCETGACLSWSQITDGVQDCLDASDESPHLLYKKTQYCKFSGNCSCPVGTIKCSTSKECINASLMCDGKTDCQDLSDEEYCNKDGVSNCVAYLNMTRPEALCDGIPHCYDRSDEAWSLCTRWHNDSNICEQASALRCSKSGGGCVGDLFVCDGVKDCPNGEDEKSCVAIMSPSKALNEGRLMSRSFGKKWSAHCLSEEISRSKLDRICQLKGFRRIETVLYDNITTESTIIDVFTKLVLNNYTSFGIRTYNRPFVYKSSNVPCRTVYINCKV